MMTVQVTNQSGATLQCDIDLLPDSCPVCLFHVHPKQLVPFVQCTPGGGYRSLQAAFKCPRYECACLFISRYRYNEGESFNFADSVPLTVRVQHFPKSINEISPTFVKIFNQAAQAEAGGLDQIGGVGYRKALEFLVKDYCIRRRPGDKDSIESATLAMCINNYVADQNIKEIASRAVWIGNDETHYVRIWTGHDITDLKRLMAIAVNWIDNEKLAEEYRAALQKPSKPASGATA